MTLDKLEGVVTTFGDILMNIKQYPYHEEGTYAVFVPTSTIKQHPEKSQLTSKTPSMVLFYTIEQANAWINDNTTHPIAAKNNFCDIGYVSFMKEIVRAAKMQKPDCTPDDLVKSYEYYMEADAFYDFTEPPLIVTIRFLRNVKPDNTSNHKNHF